MRKYVRVLLLLFQNLFSYHFFGVPGGRTKEVRNNLHDWSVVVRLRKFNGERPEEVAGISTICVRLCLSYDHSST